MSGGYFEYKQWNIEVLASEISAELKEMGKPIPKEALLLSDSFYERFPKELTNRNYSDKTKQEFIKAYNLLIQSYVYVKRIDWLLSGDDGEETFHERLKEELNNLELLQ